MSRKVVSVSLLVEYLKSSLEQDNVLRGVFVEGEISNIRRPYSGHWYFSLKDDKSNISCVMFAYQNRQVNFPLNNGDKVILKGDVSVYTPQGQLQILVSSIQPSGIGQLYMQLEALKKKLNAEGLFEEIHKKELPEYPMDIALVTGNNTAAREDVLVTLKNRWPIAKIYEYPCPVQGATASKEIISSLLNADKNHHDVILLVRGGGSLEDLWCFNDENLARTIYNLDTPIVTGIGHEIDTTLADYVSDKRANTPTGAVEVAVPDIDEVLSEIKTIKGTLVQFMKARCLQEKQYLEHFKTATVFTKPERLFSEQTIHLQYLEERLSTSVKMVGIHTRNALSQITQIFSVVLNQNTRKLESDLNDKTNVLKHTMERNLTACRNTLQKNVTLLDAYSPLKVMERGYSVITKENQVVTSVEQLHIKDEISIRLSKGQAHAIIQDLKE